MKTLSQLFLVFLLFYSYSYGQTSQNTIDLSNNLYTIMGAGIEEFPVDIDSDGKMEIICCSGGSYWYIMRYNPIRATYNTIWTSPIYERGVSSFKVVDLNGDGKLFILLGTGNTLQILDVNTKSVIIEKYIDFDGVSSIDYADADNDGKKEIITSSYETTHILNPKTLKEKFQIEQGGSVKVGNIDDDVNNEIVLSSGIAYQLKDSVLTTEWSLNYSGSSSFELSDIDKDEKKELIWHKHFSSTIDVYDAETSSIKYSLKPNMGVDYFTVLDVNGDGIDEIIYSDNAGDKIYCCNSVNQFKLWEVNSPQRTIDAVSYADVDNDGVPELIWTTGGGISSSDYLCIYNKKDNVMKWQSEDIVTPFYSIEAGDVDGDGKKEVITFSKESESGYNGGVVLILDPQTKQLKWSSSKAFPFGDEDLYDIVVKDLNKDGKDEIIVSHSSIGFGELSILDGQTHAILSTCNYYKDKLNAFYSIMAEDINQDGTPEIIASTRWGLSVINSSTLSVEWTLSLSRDNSTESVMHYADINGDGIKEFVFCDSEIKIINPITRTIETLSGYGYKNIDIFDFNNDGVDDIVGATYYGHIVVIDGKNKTILSDIEPESNTIYGVRLVKYNNEIVYIYCSNGKLKIYFNNTKYLVSSYFGDGIGRKQSLKLFSLDNSDTKTIVLGTLTSIFKLSENIFSCFDFGINLNTKAATFSNNNGQISLEIIGGIPPYTYAWSTGATSSVLADLDDNYYSVRIRDNEGCTTGKGIYVNRVNYETSIENQNKTDFQVYPNPAKNMLYINVDKKVNTDCQVEIINPMGQVVRKLSLLSNQVDLQGLKTGLYVLKVITNNSTYTKNIIIE